MPLDVGDNAPEFTIATDGGGSFSLSEMKGYNVIIYFYPKDDTPGCTIEGNDFTALNESFSEKNTVIYGVSRDSIKSHEKFKEKFSFSFELISDEDEALCNQFEVIKLKKLYGKEYMGIVRSTFVISPNGEILKHWDKVKVEDHADEVLEFVSGL